MACLCPASLASMSRIRGWCLSRSKPQHQQLGSTSIETKSIWVDGAGRTASRHDSSPQKRFIRGGMAAYEDGFSLLELCRKYYHQPGLDVRQLDLLIR
jgi:hypothetical protein